MQVHLTIILVPSPFYRSVKLFFSATASFDLQNIPAAQLLHLVYYLGSKWRPRAPASLFFFIAVADDATVPFALATGIEKDFS